MREEAQRNSSSEAVCWSGGERARRYDREVNRRFYRTALARLLVRVPNLHGRGLDLGCGTGFSTELLVADHPGVVWQGVDCSAAMLEIARRKPGLGKIDFAEARAEALPFADASFDVVVASFSWHWFGEGAGPEVRRVLRPQGWLLASVPVRHHSPARGNRILARELLAMRHQFVPRTSQGFRIADVPNLLPPPVRVARHELHVESERFADGREMLDVLDSRGALAAIFGAEPPTAIAAPAPVDFEWPFAVLHAQI
jgi:ubiquinone/menaquinone biosynthesis C-methylase UbiE